VSGFELRRLRPASGGSPSEVDGKSSLGQGRTRSGRQNSGTGGPGPALVTEPVGTVEPPQRGQWPHGPSEVGKPQLSALVAQPTRAADQSTEAGGVQELEPRAVDFHYVKLSRPAGRDVAGKQGRA